MNKELYIYCEVLPENYEKTALWYISDVPVKAGDVVMIAIKSADNIKAGIVLRSAIFTEEDAPYPVEYTRHILRHYDKAIDFAHEKARLKLLENHSYLLISDEQREKLKIKNITLKNKVTEGKFHFPEKYLNSQNIDQDKFDELTALGCNAAAYDEGELYNISSLLHDGTIHEIDHLPIREIDKELDLEVLLKMQYKGPEKTIEMAARYLKHLDRIYNHIKVRSLENGFAELSVINPFMVAPENRPTILLEKYPELKATAFYEEWDTYDVLVLYSESGYSCFTDYEAVGDFDRKSGIRWTDEHFPAEPSFVEKFDYFSDDDDEIIEYEFPYIDEWNTTDYVISSNGKLYQMYAKELADE